MCELCNGATYQQVIERQVEHTRRRGWAMVHVGDEQAWTYTIGLSWTFGHPELVRIGRDHRATAAIFDGLVERIGAGSRFGVGSTHRCAGGQVIFGAVHPRNLAGEWFLQWAPVARSAGHGTAGLRALQVIGTDEASCPVCLPSLVLLESKISPARIVHPRHDRPSAGRRAAGGRP